MSRTNRRRAVAHDRAPAINIVEYSESLTPAEVATIVTVEEAFTVTGVKSGDMLLSVSSPTINVGIAGAYISADDEVTLAFVNPTAGALTPTAGVYKFIVIQ